MTEKRERVLTVAQKIFARFGIRKTTMDEIAKMARMGKATLYYYFKSKEEIFAEVIRKESLVLKQKLAEEIARAKSPQDKIRAYVLTRMIYLKDLSNYYTTLTDEYLEHYSFVEKERKEFTEHEIDTLEEILSQGVEQSVFEMEDIRLTARMIAIALKGLEYPLIVENKSGDNMEVEINQMLDILFKGLEVRG
jgi:AcrR family transcriptional regulator